MKYEHRKPNRIRTWYDYIYTDESRRNPGRWTSALNYALVNTFLNTYTDYISRYAKIGNKTFLKSEIKFFSEGRCGMCGR